ncbi:MAG TPA: 50S ribosomal protein L20 [Candidatus Paceibacterota bacterium]|nr:50S ribosomal protein L20 [Candidatus Paceibacterota bacterium]HRV32093.1 50S ribosomal protein L20 [Candidatus Paceibacterota bacterium]
MGAAAKEYSISYNQLIKLLKEHHIELDRKVLSELAQNYNDIFKEIVTKIK